MFKDLGSRRTIILGLADKTAENYDNVSMLMSKIKPLNIQREFKVASDSKMKNILSGIRQH